MAGMKGSVDDALKMDMDEDFRDFSSPHEHVLNGHRAFVMDYLLEIWRIEELHEYDRGIVFFFNFKNFYEIRMVQPEKGL